MFLVILCHLYTQLLRKVFLHTQVVNDEYLPLRGVLAHIVFQQLLYLRVLRYQHRVFTYIIAYEAGELLGAYLPQPFKSGDLGLGTYLGYGTLALFITVAINGLLLIAHTEQWCL